MATVMLRDLSRRTDNFCPILRRKDAHRKRKEKRTEKRDVLTEFFPNFLCVFFLHYEQHMPPNIMQKTAHATEKRPPNNSARESITAQRAGILSTCPFDKQKHYPEKPKLLSARSSAPLCLPTHSVMAMAITRCQWQHRCVLSLFERRQQETAPENILY